MYFSIKNKNPRIIRTGKVRIINMDKQLFDVVAVRLMEEYVELTPRYGTIVIGYRTSRRLWSCGWKDVRPSPKYLEINEFFNFFTVVICM